MTVAFDRSHPNLRSEEVLQEGQGRSALFLLSCALGNGLSCILYIYIYIRNRAKCIYIYIMYIYNVVYIYTYIM